MAVKKSANKMPPQKQRRPGSEKKMHPKPLVDDPYYIPGKKLHDKVAIITGGDSGIGKAVAILFAKEGAKLVVTYLNEHEDAQETRLLAEQYGAEVVLMAGDISKESFCKKVIKKTIKTYGKLNILVNNAAVQYEAKGLEKIETKNMLHTFAVNIFAMFYLTKAALHYMKKGSCIINTASVTAYRGSPELIDYSATKGAIVTFTRSLSGSLADKEIRVNAVAPGPIWTPLIPSSFSAAKTGKHGIKTPMARVGQPVEVAPAYLFLATQSSTYMSGQVLHPNGGEIING